MEQMCGRLAIAPASATDSHAQPADPAAAEEVPALCGALLALACLLLRGLVVALVAAGVARAAWRARHDAWGLSFVVGPAVLLALLFLCLRSAERLPADAHPAERRRLQAAVWALTTAISGIFAFRVAAAMPPALAALVWCMTAAVVIAGFYMLVIYEEQQEYQSLDGVGDGKASNKLRPTDESV